MQLNIDGHSITGDKFLETDVTYLALMQSKQVLMSTPDRFANFISTE